MSHFKDDGDEVEAFTNYFANTHSVFIPKVLEVNDNDDFINRDDKDYVMSRIREKYLQDSTETIVLLGSCTHSRRYVDLEVKSSLRVGHFIPNGLMGIALPSRNNLAHLSPRLKANWNSDHHNCYSRYLSYPGSPVELVSWIEDAYLARTSCAHLIANTKDMMRNKGKCKICGVTH
ncbi:MAG: TIR domain-containing protein [Pedobacter sp.]